MSRTTTCPNGHISADPQWCDTCGARLGVEPAASPPANAAPPSAPVASSGSLAAGVDSVPCPHCGAANVADALFCEECGYDFTTGQAPEPLPTATLPAVPGRSPAQQSSAAGPAPAGPAHPPATAAAGAALADTSAVGPQGWIVIVEVDPVWFALKGTLADRPCPSASSSTIALGQAMVHIGRSSQSRSIHPEIAIDSDTAVSRQHAQLIATSREDTPKTAERDDQPDDEPDAYAAVDLGSTNGTFFVPAGSEPTESIEPIAPGVPVILADRDRLYVGAWSRLTVRHTGG